MPIVSYLVATPRHLPNIAGGKELPWGRGGTTLCAVSPALGQDEGGQKVTVIGYNSIMQTWTSTTTTTATWTSMSAAIGTLAAEAGAAVAGGS